MKAFAGKVNPADWGNKLNFVDENNVVVGFGAESSCCESFGYFFTPSEPLEASRPIACSTAQPPVGLAIAALSHGSIDSNAAVRLQSHRFSVPPCA